MLTEDDKLALIKVASGLERDTEAPDGSAVRCGPEADSYLADVKRLMGLLEPPSDDSEASWDDDRVEQVAQAVLARRRQKHLRRLFLPGGMAAVAAAVLAVIGLRLFLPHSAGLSVEPRWSEAITLQVGAFAREAPTSRRDPVEPGKPVATSGNETTILRNGAETRVFVGPLSTLSVTEGGEITLSRGSIVVRSGSPVVIRTEAAVCRLEQGELLASVEANGLACSLARGRAVMTREGQEAVLGSNSVAFSSDLVVRQSALTVPYWAGVAEGYLLSMPRD